MVTKIEETAKAIKSKIKENAQGTNSDRKETRNPINSLDQKEEINSQPEQNEERIQKMRRGLGTSRTALEVPTSDRKCAVVNNSVLLLRSLRHVLAWGRTASRCTHRNQSSSPWWGRLSACPMACPQVNPATLEDRIHSENQAAVLTVQQKVTFT